MGLMELRGTISRDRPLLVVAMHEEALHYGFELPVLVTGPGKVHAAIAVATLLAGERPSSIVNVGTAGALRAGLEGIHEIGTVSQHDFDDAGLHDITGQHFGAPIVIGDGLVLTTGDRCVAGGPVRDALAQHADLVDMEGYAVAAACIAADIPVRLIKIVSDDAGRDAAASWVDGVADLAHALSVWVNNNLL